MCNWKLIVACIGAGICIVGAVLGWGVFPNLIRNQIKENVVLREGTDQFERWKVLPQPMHFKSYLFNITNPDEVLSGAKPILEEIGPFVYWQHRHREGVAFSEDSNTISSHQFQRYEYDARASAPWSLDDPIYTVSVHVVGIFEFVEKNMPAYLPILPEVLETIFNVDSIIMKTTPREFLFDGIHFCQGSDPISKMLCGMIAGQAPKTIQTNPDGSLRFSLYAHKADFHDGDFVVYTGEHDIYRTQDIVSWNGKHTLTLWNNKKEETEDVCNMINGTDSSFFRPFLTPESDNLFVFNTDVCRSSELEYHSETTYEGIPGLQYRIASSFLSEMDECFCSDSILGSIKQDNGCLFKGAMDLTPCMGTS